MKQVSCRNCLLAPHCAYATLFEPYERDGKGIYAAGDRIPSPMVIEPPPLTEEIWNADVALPFDVLLFGEGLRFAPHLIAAVKQMCDLGLGQRRIRFRLFRATAIAPGAEELLYRDDKTLSPKEVTGNPLWSMVSSSPIFDTVGIQMVTPLRIASNGRTEIPVGFRSFVRSLYSRASTLATGVDAQEVGKYATELMEKTETVHAVTDHQKRSSVTRWSNRQKRAHDLVGVMGHVVWKGDGMRDFGPLIRAGEILHAGKATMFGFGKYVVEEIS